MSVDEGSLMMLMSMGLTEIRAKKALIACNNNVEQATDWIFSHMDDPGIDDPLPEEKGSSETDLDAEINDPQLHQEYCNLFDPMKSNIKTPSANDAVYKDECVGSFSNGLTPGGLYICLKSFLAFGENLLGFHQIKTKQPIYLHRITEKKEVEEMAVEKKEQTAPTVIGIGVDGGFDSGKKKYTEEDIYTLFVYETKQEIPVKDNVNLPAYVKKAVNGIINAESGTRKAEVNTWVLELKESEAAKTLVQLDNGVKVPPTGIHCAKCDINENLWMNLTDGTILCGRKQAGMIGNGHALEYYKETGYPLCVKLGTITPDGADVFSYKEDDMVKDPLLEKHLAHFGINMNVMTKTEKTMAEYDLDLNVKHEWNVITEDGEDLEKCHGPGFTGLINLGNTCYMASVLQMMFMIPDFIDKYYKCYERVLEENLVNDPANNFYLQISKLAFGLCSGEYSKKSTSENAHIEAGIRPLMFKTLVGKGDAEFSTNRQQDASQFFQYFLEYIRRKERTRDGPDPSDVFRFELEEKLICGDTKKVRYSKNSENLLPLSIPIEFATNQAEYDEYQVKKSNGETDLSAVSLKVPFEKCFESFFSGQQLTDWLSPASNRKTTATKELKFASFPKYLIVQLQRFYVDKDWSPKKLDVCVDFPDELDITHLKGKGLEPGEELLVDNTEAAENTPQFDQSIVNELLAAGFPENACKRAAMKNNSLEDAMNWCLINIESPDFNAPIEPPSSAGAKEPESKEEDIAMVMSMGFSSAQARKALKNTSGDVNRAVEWIFSHSDAMSVDDDNDNETDNKNNNSDNMVGDNIMTNNSECGKYSLIGFISHMGSSTLVGHYVCHLKKGENNNFVLFNDEKVAVSKNPPKAYGYMYLMQRKDTI